MTKNIIALFAIALVFSSCKKCYECDLTEYCLEYSLTLAGITTTDDQCFDNRPDRDATASSLEAAGATVTTDQQGVGYQQLCGRSSVTQTFVTTWEAAGYNCTEQ